MGVVAHLLREIPSATRYKEELEQLEEDIERLRKENLALKIALAEANEKLAELRRTAKPWNATPLKILAPVILTFMATDG